MGKIVLWIVIVFAVLFALRLMNAAKARQRRASKPPAVESMVRCVSCGVYLPRTEAKAGPAGLTCGDPVCLSR